MKNDPAHDRFHELLWKRSRTDSDEAELRSWLSSHPDSQQDADAEEHLNALLDRLPDAPVSSNFTARVLDAVERDCHAPGSTRPVARSVDWLWRSLLPRVAVVAVLTAAGFLAWHRHETEQRAELA
ncbi:MAG TPA: hypothetical protein PKA41_05520, partial [Verrucomicrobiota bacterium]|nr:hypothetical protein [Verrucomicrobiota bacterium]